MLVSGGMSAALTAYIAGCILCGMRYNRRRQQNEEMVDTATIDDDASPSSEWQTFDRQNDNIQPTVQQTQRPKSSLVSYFSAYMYQRAT